MEQMLPITLYIPCYNAEPFLDRVPPAVKMQTYPIAQTFIVDDGSTDRTAEIAEHHGIEIVRHDVNRGLGAARNTAVHAAETEYIACLDADVVPHPNWLERLVPSPTPLTSSAATVDVASAFMQPLRTEPSGRNGRSNACPSRFPKRLTRCSATSPSDTWPQYDGTAASP